MNKRAALLATCLSLAGLLALYFNGHVDMGMVDGLANDTSNKRILNKNQDSERKALVLRSKGMEKKINSDSAQMMPYNEVPSDLADDKNQINAVSSVSQRPAYRLNFEERGHNEEDVSNISPVLAEHGRMIDVNVDKLRNMPIGQTIKLNLFGEEVEGAVAKNEVTKLGAYVQIQFSDDPLQYMLLYYGDAVVEGRIYTAANSYIIQHNGKVGFVLPLVKYQQLIGNPVPD